MSRWPWPCVVVLGTLLQARHFFYSFIESVAILPIGVEGLLFALLAGGIWFGSLFLILEWRWTVGWVLGFLLLWCVGCAINHFGFYILWYL